MATGALRIAGIVFALVMANCAEGGMGLDGDDEGGDGKEDSGSGTTQMPPDDQAPVISTDSALEITAPPRGSFIASAPGKTVAVTGKVTDQLGRELTINGTVVPLAADGSFNAVITPAVGTNVIDARLSESGATAQRAFVYGKFNSTGISVPAAVALRVNATGFNDNSSDIDDLSTLAEEGLAARKVMTLFPSSFSADAGPVNINVSLPTRTAGRPNVSLSTRTGGMTASVSLPSVYVKFDVSFSCLITTCHVTGNVTSTSANLSLPVTVSLSGSTISAAAGSVSLSLAGFDYDIDGSLGGVAETVINFFIPNVRGRLESFLRGQIANAIPNDVGVALSELQLPTSFTLPSPLVGRVNITQRFDAVSFSSTGGTVAAAVRAYGTFLTGDPGIGAPGWLSVGSTVGTYRTTSAFGISLSHDLLNQVLYAVWGQGAFNVPLPEFKGEVTPAGTTGDVRVEALSPPTIVGSAGALTVSVGDLILTTTLDGQPFKLAASFKSSLELSLDTVLNVARLEVVGTPTLVVEVLEAPAGMNKGELNAFMGAVGSFVVIKLVESVRVPVPRIPLAAVAPAYASKTMKLVSPAEVVLGSPTGRTTLYGRPLFALNRSVSRSSLGPFVATGDRNLAITATTARRYAEPMPTRFGAYTIHEALGAGGMASVHLADWRPPGGVARRVALKRLFPQVADNEELLAMFIDEARLARYLSHPNIAQVYEFGRITGTYYIAFEYVKGPTVQQLMRQCDECVGYIPVPLVLEIIIQLCDALHHAHNLTDEENLPLGIVHRDVSPQNLIVSTVGFVKLIDFGLAKAKQSSVESNAGIIKGKVNYVAPEYLDGNLDVRCDLWAVGVVMHEMLTGRRLFDAPDHRSAVDIVRTKPIPKPSRYRVEVPRALDDIVMTALERDPNKRWQNAASLRAALAGQAKSYPLVTKSQLVTWIEWAFKQKAKTREDSGVAALDTILESGVELVEDPKDPGSALARLPATSAAVLERQRESVAQMPYLRVRPRLWPWLLLLLLLAAVGVAGLHFAGVVDLNAL